MLVDEEASEAPLSVVIVHRKQPGRLAETIRRLRSAGVPIRVIVVDNGSGPGDLALIRTLDIDHLIENGFNAGFGAGANAGLRFWLERGAGEWVALGPHDVLVDEDCIARILAAVDGRPRAGLVCADVGDGSIPVIDAYLGGITRRAVVDHGWEDADHPHGTFMFARRRCLEEVGLFDEAYFAYCEEADLGIRARRAGWEVGVVVGAMVKNATLGSNTALVDYLQQRNTLMLVRRYSGLYHASIRSTVLLIQLARGLAFPGSRPPIFDASARARALADHWRGRYGPPPSRFAGPG